MRTRILLLAALATLAAVLAAGCGGSRRRGRPRRRRRPRSRRPERGTRPARRGAGAARRERVTEWRRRGGRPAADRHDRRHRLAQPLRRVQHRVVRGVRHRATRSSSSTTRTCKFDGRLGRELGASPRTASSGRSTSSPVSGPTARRSPPRTPLWTCRHVLKYAKGPTSLLAPFLSNVGKVEAPDRADARHHVLDQPVAQSLVLTNLQQFFILPKHVWSQYDTERRQGPQAGQPPGRSPARRRRAVRRSPSTRRRASRSSRRTPASMERRRTSTPSAISTTRTRTP